MSLYNSNNLRQKPLSLCLSPLKMASSLLNQIEKKSSKMLFGLVYQNVFGTDCGKYFIYLAVKEYATAHYEMELICNWTKLSTLRT